MKVRTIVTDNSRQSIVTVGIEFEKDEPNLLKALEEHRFHIPAPSHEMLIKAFGVAKDDIIWRHGASQPGLVGFAFPPASRRGNFLWLYCKE